MSKFMDFLMTVLNNSVESVSIKNNNGEPQLVITPKGAVKDLVQAAQKVMKENDQTTQEDH